MTEIVVSTIDAYVFRRTEDGLLFLILQRSKIKLYDHLWQGVAGKIEAGESAPEAVQRELMEETRLKPKHIFVADHISRFYDTRNDRINLVPIFGIEVDSEEIILSDEHSNYKWVSLDEAQNHLIWHGQKQGIQVVNDMVLVNDDRIRWSTIK